MSGSSSFRSALSGVFRREVEGLGLGAAAGDFKVLILFFFYWSCTSAPVQGYRSLVYQADFSGEDSESRHRPFSCRPT